MPQNYVPIFIFIAFVGVLIPVTLLAAKLVRPDNPSKTKLMPYECGIDPIDSSRGRYTVRYYIVAILFVVFDVETIFLFPWAVQFKALGVFGLIEMLIFLVILVVGYIWIWKKGALEWIYRVGADALVRPAGQSPAVFDRNNAESWRALLACETRASAYVVQLICAASAQPPD